MNFLKEVNESIIKQGKANRSSLLVAQGGKLTRCASSTYGR